MKPTPKFLTFIIALSATLLASALPSFAQEDFDRQETSLLSVTPINTTTHQDFAEQYSLHGKLYNKAFVQFIDVSGGLSLFPNTQKYDLFEADLAVNCDDPSDMMKFYVLGDGDIIYESPHLTNHDKFVHISIPISQYSAISLSVRGIRIGGLPRAVWADPKFVRLVHTSLPITSPIAPNALLTPDSSDLTAQNTVLLGRDSAGRYTISINGTPVSFGNVRPQMKSGRLLVPMRPLFEALGAKIVYNNEDQTIRATLNKREVKMQLNSTDASIDGDSVPLDVPAQALGGTTMVPFRFVVEALNVQIKYSSDNN